MIYEFNLSFEIVVKKKKRIKGGSEKRDREKGKEKGKIISKVYEIYRAVKEIIMNIPEG